MLVEFQSANPDLRTCVRRMEAEGETPTPCALMNSDDATTTVLATQETCHTLIMAKLTEAL